ncbi:MAG: c-type cytochrome [Gammaproteobacteria bacterium]
MALGQTRSASNDNAPPPDTMEARVQGCSTCHGPEGQGTQDDYFPRIAGKPQGYLLNQLRNFRDGRRSYPPMNYLLAYLHDDYFTDMAQHFASLQIPFAKPAASRLPRAQLSLGENLVRQGNAARSIPACTTCHGPLLTGINPGIPGLIGLHSRYISAQLESWRTGTRRAVAPDCMHDVARRLKPEEITAVAGWLAAQSAPPSSQPAPAGSWKPPVACGSQPQ